MPEGNVVHRLARTFGSLYGGQVLRLSSPQGRFADGAAMLSGRRLVASEAWGKQLFLGFVPAGVSVDQDTGAAAGPDLLWLRVHLGLYGAWTFAGSPDAPEVAHAIGAPRKRIGERETPLPVGGPAGSQGSAGDDEWLPPEPRGQVRVRLLGDHAVADLNGPTACEVITTEEKTAVQVRLGPDPIRDDADVDAFVAAVGRSKVTIAQLLMDQSVISGAGNIYRAEVLYRMGVDPLRPGRDVPTMVVRAIWDDLVDLMREGVERGAIVTTRPEHRELGGTLPAEHQPPARRGRTRQNADGDPGAVPSDQAFYVYHRAGLPCRICGTPVLIKELAGRNLFWCPTCQT
ncbi:zinc finger domain-containing protein [Promicromonospora sp. NPDC023805]|uniref:Fpg/Nei family DNA glycosylase n=1 Tax=Promicromonospora sp. NPDC023805 TaxID=3154696 RepID=UPI00340EDF57